MDNKILEKERKTDFEISRLCRFRYRTRYFSDSGIIGTKEFVLNDLLDTLNDSIFMKEVDFMFGWMHIDIKIFWGNFQAVIQ